jgi:predicted TPR repeat methyltransferase
MKPEDIGKAYNQITHLWDRAEFDSNNGIEQHERAIAFVKNRRNALDIGCGSTGRIIDLLLDKGFKPEGVDISAEMIRLATIKHPDINFHYTNICEWELPETYDFISAWDSLWHIPLDQQTTVLTKLIENLNTDGVLLFSFGGLDEAAEHTDASMGPELYYSSLGVSGYLKLLMELDCTCRHFAYDQYPDLHAYLIVQKN